MLSNNPSQDANQSSGPAPSPPAAPRHPETPPRPDKPTPGSHQSAPHPDQQNWPPPRPQDRGLEGPPAGHGNQPGNGQPTSPQQPGYGSAPASAPDFEPQPSPGLQPGYGGQPPGGPPGYVPPASAPSGGYAGVSGQPPSYGAPGGHGAQPGYGAPGGYGTPGYGNPPNTQGQYGPGGAYGAPGGPGQPFLGGRGEPPRSNRTPLYVVLGILLLAIVGVIAYVLLSTPDGDTVAPTPGVTTQPDPTSEPEPTEDLTEEPTDEPDPGDPPPFPESFGDYQLLDEPGYTHVEYAGPWDSAYVWLHPMTAVEEASEEFTLSPVGDWMCGEGVYDETSCFIQTPHGALEVYQYGPPPSDEVHYVAVEFLEAWLG